MSKVFDEFADEYGPEKIVYVYEPRSGLKGIIVIDNVSAGPGIGEPLDPRQKLPRKNVLVIALKLKRIGQRVARLFGKHLEDTAVAPWGRPFEPDSIAIDRISGGQVHRVILRQ